jgi:hypothetical protein
VRGLHLRFSRALLDTKRFLFCAREASKDCTDRGDARMPGTFWLPRAGFIQGPPVMVILSRDRFRKMGKSGERRTPRDESFRTPKAKIFGRWARTLANYSH